MRHDLGRGTRALLLPTIALLGIVTFAPGRIELALRVYALVVATVAIVLGVSALRRSLPPARPLVPPRRGGYRAPTPETIERLQNQVALGIDSALDLHVKLRPRLRELARELLVAHRSLDLDEQPEAARRLLGEETWETISEQAEPPADRTASGISPKALDRAVASLERL